MSKAKEISGQATKYAKQFLAGITDAKTILLLVIILILLGGVIYMVINHKNKINAVNYELALKQRTIDSVFHAKPKIDTVHDTIHIKSPIIQTQPQPVDSSLIYHIISAKIGDDTVSVDVPLYNFIYKGVIQNDYFNQPYTITVFGRLEHIEFGDPDIFQKTIIETKYVPIYETVERPAKMHMYVPVMVGAGKFGSFESGLALQFKNMWAVEFRWQYVHQTSVWKVGAMIPLF